jgi:hypothetical protein
MGKGSAPSNQTVTQTNLPAYARPYFENIMQRAQAESYRPYQKYEAERIAGFNPEQQQVQQETMGLQTPGEFGTGSQFASAGGLGSLGMGMQAAGAGQQYMNMATDPSQIQAFMSPYQQAVTDVAKSSAMREAQLAQRAGNLQAGRRSGALGSSGNILAQAERERGALDRMAQIQAEGSQKAFESARQAQQFGSTLGLQGLQTGLQGMQQLGQAGATLGQLGTQRQTADLQRLTAQEAVGAQQRAFEQQQLDQRYADFLRQRDYPMEQLGYFSNLMRGVGPSVGSTQITYAPTPSMMSQVGGLGLAGLGLYNMYSGGAGGGGVPR